MLDTTCILKRKRYPDGTVDKLKARLCVRGDQQEEGVDYFDTYTPVVQWGTVRFLLILAVYLGIATKQVDYTNAFVQSPKGTTAFIRHPRLFERIGYVLKLKRSVYGLHQSPKNFFQYLKKGLKSR